MATTNIIKKSVILVALTAVANFANAQEVLKSDTLVSEKNGSFEIVIRQTVVMNDDLGREGTYILTKTLDGKQLSLYKKAHEETTSESPQKADTGNVQTQSARQSAMNMAGHGNSKGCFHAGIYADNAENHAKGRAKKLWMSNCNGLQFFAGAELNISEATSEMGTFNNTVVMARVGAEYELWGFRPSVSFATGQKMSVEGNEFSSKEFSFALNYDFFRHEWYSFSIGANYTYKLMKSTKAIETSKVSMTLPYSGNASSFGVQVSKDIHLGYMSRKASFSDGMYNYTYEKRGEMFLRLYGSFNPYKVEKLEGSDLSSTLKFNKNFNVGVAFVVRPAW